eukprot:6202506-Pleurochrysis_carterae.AAC.1
MTVRTSGWRRRRRSRGERVEGAGASASKEQGRAPSVLPCATTRMEERSARGGGGEGWEWRQRRESITVSGRALLANMAI